MNNPTPDQWSDKPKQSLKTNYKDPKKRYELAERMIWAKLPDWKRQTIIECKVNGVHNNRIFDEYAQEIILLAENEKAVLSDTYPPVPHLSAENLPLTK